MELNRKILYLIQRYLTLIQSCIYAREKGQGKGKVGL